MKVLAMFCYIVTLASLLFIAITGERWPLSFAVVMLVFGIIIPLGERGLGRDR